MNQEQIVDNIIMDELEVKHPGSKELILSKTTKESRRLAVLSILDDDRRLFEQYKNIVRSEEYCSHYAEETVQVLRQYIKVADTEVKEHGEVMTPLTLVEEMLDKLPTDVWSNPSLKWLDPCNGVGTFPSIVVKRLMVGLKDVISNDCERYRHIIENMIYVCEIQAKNMFLFHTAFDREDDYELNTYYGSFLDKGFDEHMLNVWGFDKFDIVLGNPPYKKGLHHDFVIKSFELLNKNGNILFLHPSLVFINRKGLTKSESENKLIEIAVECETEITLIQSSDYFDDVFVYIPLSITNIKKTKSKKITLINKVFHDVIKEEITSLDDIFIHNNPLVRTIKRKVFDKMELSIQDKFVKNGAVGNHFLIIATFTGHKPKGNERINPDFYTMINKKYENDFNFSITDDANTEKKGQLIALETVNQCINTSRYLTTKFARFCLSFYKINQALFNKEPSSVPFVDPNILWTDEMLFDYFELTQEERDYINTFIPNYYQRDFQNIPE